jgi:hypothetical protein
VYGISSFFDTCAAGNFCSTTIAAADSITSSGHARRDTRTPPSRNFSLP